MTTFQEPTVPATSLWSGFRESLLLTLPTIEEYLQSIDPSRYEKFLYFVSDQQKALIQACYIEFLGLIVTAKGKIDVHKIFMISFKRESKYRDLMYAVMERQLEVLVFELDEIVDRLNRYLCDIM